MTDTVSRRKLVTGALRAPAAALAQNSDRRPPKLWSDEYWAQKGAVKLYMFRKRIPAVPRSIVTAPVLLVRGEYDSLATMSDLTDFFSQLPSGDRQFVVLPGMAHSVVMGLHRQTFWHAMHAFLSMPSS
jgi:alpha-beta hydrolase superfamily lysophospholipase